MPTYSSLMYLPPGLYRGSSARGSDPAPSFGPSPRRRPSSRADGHPGVLQHHRQRAQDAFLSDEGCQREVGEFDFRCGPSQK